ncbi:MAG: hypothetical protein LBH31_09785 [Burkholderiaceae bacterium]|jgi:pilus assembly protein FimV|nr:hypothetical protein [Burkholderiaceae bacterium]
MIDKITLTSFESTFVQRGFSSWKKGALATAVALALLGAHLDANALALGAIQVKSALGEPLRAEVEIPDITSEEATTFQAALGTPQEFQAAGVDYSQTLSGTHISLAHRPNGQAYLRVQGQQPINEPLLSLVIQANWAKGHVVREYTLLIDPRSPSTASAVKGNAPVLSGQRASPPALATGTTPQVATPSKTSSVEGQQVRVQRGDTAAALAQSYLPDGVSLDQMLVAMLHVNPRAFIRGNVNLIRAGAVVDMPGADQANAQSPAAARRTIIAQSRDFHAYRQGLASAAAGRGRLVSGGRRRVTSGSVQPQVQEANAEPTPQDRLTLSRGKGAGSTAGGAETRIAQSRHEQAQAARTAELNRNISELSKLAAASNGTTPATVKPAVPAINLPASSAMTPATQAGQHTLPASTATASASAAATPKPKPARHPVAAPPPESSWFDTLSDNWPIAGGVVAVLALLGGYFFLRGKQKKTDKKTSRSETKMDSDDLFSDSKIAPDSFFGANGGEHVDTRDGANSGSSSTMTYSPSQLEAAGDVDPVSEADVYLAYGRDAQAEEILREALRTYPGRSSIYLKLAEIYAKRHDAHMLETTATEARRITRGEGQDWQAIIDLGRQLDSNNPLYQASDAPTVRAPLANARDEMANTQNAGKPPHEEDAQLDMDLTDNAPLSPQTARQDSASAFQPSQFPQRATTQFASTVPTHLASAMESGAMASAQIHNIDFTPPPAAQPHSNMIDFDTVTPSAAQTSRPGALGAGPAETGDEDPLGTKLALAQEFHAIGDSDSARSLAKEVVAEASGALKIKAARFLSELG